METVSFADLYQMDYSMLRLVAFPQRWKNGDVFSTPPGGRPNSGLMFFADCETEYTVRGLPPFSAARGDLTLLPQGAEYTCLFRGCGAASPASAFLINFELFDAKCRPLAPNGEIRVMRAADSATCFLRFQEILTLFGRRAAPASESKALFYRLLTDLSLEVRQARLPGERFAMIERGIAYLECHCDAPLRVKELARMCHVSETYFRRLFRQYAGVSPLEYVIGLKMAKARLMLENGARSVTEVAEALGYDDPNYFSRLYKQKSGVSPAAAIRGAGRRDAGR